MSKRTYAELIDQYERPRRRSFNWNWLGWPGVPCLLLFVSFLFFPNELDFLRSPVVAVMVVAAMIASVVLPSIAAVRGSKWWLLVSALGVLASLMFFSVVNAV